ncbi:MAG: acetoacetate decarboxylase family protein [Mycobacteriales bacterium]
MRLEHHQGWNIPPDAPFYPNLPATYRDVKFHFIFFRARPEAVHDFLPEPLEASSDGMCVASGMEIPFCSAYGPFLEAFVMLKCRFRQQEGYYCSHAFHNGPAGIAAGREIYGTPKVFAQISVRKEERAMVTEAVMGGCRVLQISSVADQMASPKAMHRLTPAWRLKLIPRADRPEPAIKQLIDCSNTTRDQVVHYFARGHGVVDFAASPYIDLTPLKPLSYEDAFYMESSYSEHYAEVIYDYLVPGRSAKSKAGKNARERRRG